MPTIIFGGAFDPPHIEHFRLLKAAVSELKADKVVIVPTYMPPHKSQGFLSFEQRVELIKIAFDGLGVPFVIDEVENKRKCENYTSKILPILKEKYGDIVFLIGGDSLEFFYTWKNPEIITKCCPIAVVGRNGFKSVAATIYGIKTQFGGNFISLGYVGEDISSSVIKAKLLMGEDVDELNGSVKAYIKQNCLFCEYREIVEKLKTYQSPSLFNHSKCVVIEAVKLNAKHNLKQNFKKVFLAALLHDNAKERPSLDGLSVPEESINSPVLHQFLGAEKARRDFDITDNEILNAIRYHTTAKPDMSELEKLIYTADSVSGDREYPPIPAIRAVAERDFNEGFETVLRYTYEKIQKKGRGMYPLTEEAARFYLR